MKIQSRSNNLPRSSPQPLTNLPPLLSSITCLRRTSDMPNHALYYPEWNISDPTFLAESLLYWDRLACIVPFSDFKERPWHPDKEMRKAMGEAHEKYVSPYVPTDEVKR